MDTTLSLVSTEHKFVLWWHHKSACTLMKGWFAAVLGLDFTWNEYGGGRVGGESVHQLPGMAFHYDNDKHQGFYHFTVVRNPRARLVSQYRQCIDETDPRFNSDTGRPPDRQSYDSFREFVGIVCSTPSERLEYHVALQWPPVEGVPLDAVVHLESIDAEWPAIVERIGLAHVPLPEVPDSYRKPRTADVDCCADWTKEQFTESKLYPPWECFFDDTLTAITQVTFAKDLEQWYR